MVTIKTPWNYGSLKSLAGRNVDLSNYDGKPGNYMKQVKLNPVYGPIISRRLGASLGINPLKGGFACNWNCTYCQYGKQGMASSVKKRKMIFSTPFEIKTALEEQLPKVLAELDIFKLKGLDHKLSLTICGPTEPTLSPYINEIIEVVDSIRKKYSNGRKIKTDMFTNGTNLGCENLNLLDSIFIKLDVGRESTFKRFNRPRNGSTLRSMVEKIKSSNIKHKIIQTMLVAGEEGNTSYDEIVAYIELLRSIKPQEVQLYTILYNTRNFAILPVAEDKLLKIAEMIERAVFGTKVIVFGKPVKEGREWLY